jgi:methionyl aminopeptidase
MIYLKKPEEIAIMKEGGAKIAEILARVVAQVRPGASTAELDRDAELRIRSIGGEPAFKGYRAFGIQTPFPGSLCISINDEIVHGLPYPERIFREGDVVSIDIGMKYKGFFLDTAFTTGAGKLSNDNENLLATARGSLDFVIEEIDRRIKSGDRPTTGDIGALVQEYVEEAGFTIVRDYIGHGVGKSLHEEPDVPNFRIAGPGELLRPGLVIAIEPMIHAGKAGTLSERNNWPVRTRSGSPAAHFEHTVAITLKGLQVLTKTS